MIHVASLLHDDVIDDAGTRRGLSAVNTVFGNKVRRWVCSVSLVSLVMCVQLHSASPHNNTPVLALPLPPLPPCPRQVAILAGDFLLARASVSLAALRDPEVIRLMSQCLEHLVAGEVLQVGASYRVTAEGSCGSLRY